MKKFKYRVTMKNGISYIVLNKHQQPTEFINELLGAGKSGITVTHYETENEFNAVAIINTEVNSVEYVTEWFN